MMRCLPILVLSVFLFTTIQAEGQNLNWHVTAQAGTANHHFQNFQGAVMAGFKSQEGQQLSVGPVMKGYAFNQQMTNVFGARIYSQVKALGSVSFYLQCDVFGGVGSASVVASRSIMRLETGAGIVYTFREIAGISAGYNMAEFNPLSNQRKNTPALKLFYLMPFQANR